MMASRKSRAVLSAYNRWLPPLFAAALVILAIQLLFKASQTIEPHHLRGGIHSAADTLVIYVFSYTNPEYKENLLHFVRHGINEHDGCQYVIVVQTEDGTARPPKGMTLPTVPSNVMYEFHPNGCYDWGTIGWVLENGRVNWHNYKYFIFMNSSVRGPFLPPAVQNLISWQELLLNKLRGDVKLVGPTISCEGSPYQGNIAAEWRSNPHVQSYVLATDKVGLTAWIEDGNVFKCYQSMWDTIYYSEIGSSLVLLNKGYNIDSLMMRYQGVDWRDQRNWGCNARINPYAQRYYDGINLLPTEVMFIKIKDFVLANDWEAARTAVKYAKWQDEQLTGAQDVTTNEWTSNSWAMRMQQFLYMKARGSSCFDSDHYVDVNRDLVFLTTPEARWTHWLNMGQFEGRPFRFTCAVPNEIPEKV